MATNNQIADKVNSQTLGQIPANAKYNANEFNLIKNFQNSPVQQFTTFVDTNILVDGSKSYSET